MEIGGRLGDVEHADVLGQLRVQRARQPSSARMREGDRGARDLAERVNAGIGAAGAMNRDRRPLESRERVFEQPLDRFAFGLTLPADEPRAVVREGEFQGAHPPESRTRRSRKLYCRFVCFAIIVRFVVISGILA